MRLGHGIVVCVPQFNHPIRIAERAATLDIISGGRLEFGTGRSATFTELGGFRAEVDHTKKSWDEFVHVIPKMWTEERFAYDGEFFSMPSRTVLPKPYQKPHPAMWVAVSSPGTEHDAADRGLGCLGVGFTSFAGQEKHVQEYRSRIQNCDPVSDIVNDQLSTINFMYCHEDDATGVKGGKRIFQSFTYMAGQLGMAKEMVPTRSYPTPGLLSAAHHRPGRYPAKGYLLGLVCDSESAADMLASTFGFRVVTGDATFESGHHRTGGRASIDGTELLEIGVAWPEPMSGDDIEWFDHLHLVSCDGEARIIQIDPEYENKEAFRGTAPSRHVRSRGNSTRQASNSPRQLSGSSAGPTPICQRRDS